MTEDQAREMLARVSYKPGFEFRLSESAGKPCLSISVSQLRDSRGYQAAVTLTHHSRLDSYELSDMNEEDFLKRVRESVVKTEIHEMHEWLKLDGNLFHDPHTECQIIPEHLALGGRLRMPT